MLIPLAYPVQEEESDGAKAPLIRDSGAIWMGLSPGESRFAPSSCRIAVDEGQEPRIRTKGELRSQRLREIRIVVQPSALSSQTNYLPAF
jgi:hypothetical protein